MQGMLPGKGTSGHRAEKTLPRKEPTWSYFLSRKSRSEFSLGFWCRVPGLGIRAQGSGFRVWGSGVRGQEGIPVLMVEDLGFRSYNCDCGPAISKGQQQVAKCFGGLWRETPTWRAGVKVEHR